MKQGKTMKSVTKAVLAGLAGVTLAGGTLAGTALAADNPLHKAPKDVSWQHQGIFGTFDRAQLQRGFQVYKEVCAACHGLRLVAFRTLEDLGYSEAQVKAIAAEYEVPDLDDIGEPVMRTALPSDRKPNPYPNDRAAAAANNNAIPPDLSLIVKARGGHEAYLYSLLTGYNETAPATTVDEEGNEVPYEVPQGLYYNPYFANVQIAMAPPLADDQVEFADGTRATVSQMSKDVTAFLAWTAEPKLENRKRMGVGVLMFVTILIILSYRSYRKVWADVKGK